MKNGGAENNAKYCFITLFQLFVFYLSMKILSSNYYINIVKIYTQQSWCLPGLRGIIHLD